MSYKKVFVIFAIFLFIVVLVGFLYSRQTEIGPNGEVVERNGFFSFLPFGRDEVRDPGLNQNPNGTNPDGSQGTTTPGFVPRLRQISTVPTAGMISFERKATTTNLFAVATTTSTTSKPTATTTTMTVVRFIERATGHIYETLSSTYTNERISNQTFNKLYNAFFEKTGNNFIAQTISSPSDTVDSFIATTGLSTSSSPQILPRFEQATLPDGLLQLLPSPAKDKIFYLTQATGGSIGFISTITTLKPTQVFTSPLREWAVQWPKDDTLVLTTKPAWNIAGMSRFIAIKDGKSTTGLNNIKGLTTLTNPDLTRQVYSESTRNSLNFYLYDVKSAQKEILTIKTLPEKCVWSKKNTAIAYCAVPQVLPLGKYPDEWYQGIHSFNDYLWKLDFANKEYRIILNPETEGRVSIDMTDLSLSEKEDYIYFTNKKDLTLWSFHLE